MRALVIYIFVLVLFLDGIVCPPVTTKQPKTEDPKGGDKEGEDGKGQEDPQFGLEYERYLKEVVSVLESDDTFRKKLEDSNVSEIKSGEIARHLEFVNHGVRTKLDELKRREIDRLRQAMKMQAQLERGMAKLPLNSLPHHAIAQGLRDMGRHLELPKLDKDRVLAHLDHRNPNTFEVDDLAKLIKQATDDLEDLDRKRRDEFKHYEMEKEREKREELQNLDALKRKEKEEEYEALKKKHADHPKVNHPGNKEQLEEVWEESDGMNRDDWDPKTFFYLHDTDGDGSLNEHEVEALFQKELDKVYGDNPEDDLVERDEEMNRMREHVFNEVDADRNKVITLQEFLASTNSDEFEKEEDWDTLEDQKIYTDEELEQYVKEYEEEQRQAYEAQGHKVPQDPSHPPPLQHLQGRGQDQGVQHMQQNVPQQGQPPADIY